MQGGINIADDIRTAFQDIRMKRKFRYVIYKASADQTSIEIEKCGERAETFDQFKENVPKNNSR